MNQDEQWLLAEKYDGEKSSAFFADCKRLESGEPLGYVIGFVPFLDCKIWLDSKPLIPRPETEFWVEKVIAKVLQAPETQGLEAESLGREWKDPGSPVRILDLCAGSGAIGVAVANSIPNSHVTLAEIDDNHRTTIFKNLAENNIDCTRYQVFTSNFFEKISGRFDYIVSNPPYIDPVLDRAEPSTLWWRCWPGADYYNYYRSTSPPYARRPTLA
jgi:release factor glutamine methyltransferase